MTVTLDLPDELAERARRSGIFEWEIERNKACDDFFAMLGKISAVSGVPMTAEEVSAEIKAASRESGSRHQYRRLRISLGRQP